MALRTERSISALSALSELADTRAAAREVVGKLQASSPLRPDMLFVFASFHHRALLRDSLDFLRRELHPAHLLATTVESVVSGTREVEHTPGLSVLALSAPGIVARPFWFDLEDGPPAVWSEGFIRQRITLPPDEGAGGGALAHRGTILFADPHSIHPGEACAAIDAAAELADGIRRKGQSPVSVLLTDGRANVARDGSGGRERAQADAMASATRLRLLEAAVLLIDTSPQPQREAAQLALALRARYLPLPYAGAAAMSHAVRVAMQEG